MKRLVFLIAVLILLAVPICPALAGVPFSLWVSPTGEKTVDAVVWMSQAGGPYLFLPGNISLEEWKIGFSGTEELSLNGKPVSRGDSASVLTVGKFNTASGKNRTVEFTVLQGSENLPAMYITTRSGSLDNIHKRKDRKESGEMVLRSASDEVEYSGPLIHMKMRGNASVKYHKKNYLIKLSESTDLEGMGKAKKWVLLGNGLDKSMLRSQITFDMARYAGLPFTPEQRQMALYVNHEYLGLYLLTERLEIDNDRVNIRNLEKKTEALNDQPLSSYPKIGKKSAENGNWKGFEIPAEPEDISGGYIIEWEYSKKAYTNASSAYRTKKGNTLVIQSPEYASRAQVQYISSFLQSFENAIFAEGGVDPLTGKHYSDLVDFDSLVNKYLINEVSKNYDGNHSSEYFYKPADKDSEKAFAGPVWDLDNTYAVYAREDNAHKVLLPNRLDIGLDGSKKYWWPALYKQPDFYAAVTEHYRDIFLPAVEILLGLRPETPVLRSLDSYAAAIEKSVELEFIRYPATKGERHGVQTGRDLAENVQYLKTFLQKRMTFLNSVWLGGNP